MPGMASSMRTDDPDHPRAASVAAAGAALPGDGHHRQGRHAQAVGHLVRPATRSATTWCCSNTLAGRVKDRQLRRDPRVSLCFEDGTDYVTIEGRAELSDDHEKALDNIWAMARRYGQGEGSFAMGDRVDITVHVERVIRHS